MIFPFIVAWVVLVAFAHRKYRRAAPAHKTHDGQVLALWVVFGVGVILAYVFFPFPSANDREQQTLILTGIPVLLSICYATHRRKAH